MCSLLSAARRHHLHGPAFLDRRIIEYLLLRVYP
jgi:hypothetical protein